MDSTRIFQADSSASRRRIASTCLPPARPRSIEKLEWERIHEVLAETGFNISETARWFGMHRRTLARKLGKRFVPQE